MPRISAEEKKWRAQDDLRTLKQAAEIAADKARHGAAKRIAADEAKKLSALAGVKPATKPKGK